MDSKKRTKKQKKSATVKISPTKVVSAPDVEEGPPPPSEAPKRQWKSKLDMSSPEAKSPYSRDRSRSWKKTSDLIAKELSEKKTKESIEEDEHSTSFTEATTEEKLSSSTPTPLPTEQFQGKFGLLTPIPERFPKFPKGGEVSPLASTSSEGQSRSSAGRPPSRPASIPLQQGRPGSVEMERMAEAGSGKRTTKDLSRKFAPYEAAALAESPFPSRLSITPPTRLMREKGAVQQQAQKASAAQEPVKEIVSTPELEKQRALLIGELLATEITYVTCLNQFVNKYIHPLRDYWNQNPKVVPSSFVDKMNPLFISAETILPLNQEFQNALEKLKASGDNRLGPTFKNFLPFLKLYTDYSNNFDTANKAVEETKESAWFKEICTDRLEFESCLISPIQRIPRYSMLLQQLTKFTPTNHPDSLQLQEALGICKNVADHVNSAISETRNFEYLTMLGLGHLFSPHRRLLLEGTMKIEVIKSYDVSKQKKIKKTYQFFLFNDLLVFMKVRKEIKAKEGKKTLTLEKNKIKFVWDPEIDTSWPLELVWLYPLDDKSFEIIGPMKTLVVKTTEMDKWFTGISDNIQNVLKSRDPDVIDDAAQKLNKRYGKFAFSTGEVYEGDWDLGRMHGKGILEFEGTCYEGNFELNLKCGFGKMEYADKQIYEGEWRSGKPHGQGTSCNTAGDKYKGEWSYGKRSGKGKLMYCNGDTYEGDWKDNLMEGQGELRLKSLNTRYVGEIHGNKYHGKGTLETYNGVYVGDFENGHQTGEGRMEYKNLEVYEGQFKNGLRHGNGKLVSPIGTFIGVFSRNLQEGKGKMMYEDGSIYEGNWSHGLRHGKGIWVQVDKNQEMAGIASYNGDWVYDLREGTGEIVYSTGDRYIGPIVAGQPHGNGKLILLSGVVFEAKMNNGVIEGKVEVTDKDHTISLEPDGQVVNQIEGVEVLIPPFVPLY